MIGPSCVSTRERPHDIKYVLSMFRARSHCDQAVRSDQSKSLAPTFCKEWTLPKLVVQRGDGRSFVGNRVLILHCRDAMMQGP